MSNYCTDWKLSSGVMYRNFLWHCLTSGHKNKNKKRLHPKFPHPLVSLISSQPLKMDSDSDSDSNFGFGGEDDNTSTEEEEATPDESVEQHNEEEPVVEERIKKKQRRFTLQDKMIILRQICHHKTQGLSQRQACIAMNIHEKQVIEWKRQWSIMRETANKKAKSLCKGRPSTLVPYTNPLLSYIFELRETGMAVSYTTVLLKAASVCREFREKSQKAQYSMVKRFVKAHGLVHRMGTHKSQRHLSEAMGEALDSIQVTRSKLTLPCHHQDYILNMDQMPVPFSYDPKSTLELVGRRTVHVRKSTNDTKRATVALCVTASGKALTPMIVFKGKPKGRIMMLEFPEYPLGMEYACQDNAWMDETVMLQWVDKVLKPYVDNAPEGIVPILFLDSYRCHIMSSIVNAVEGLGVEVEHIPGSCTYLCQPVDVGVNKPYKTHLHERWESWMFTEEIIHGMTSPPTRKHIAEWAIHANNTLTETTI